MTYISRADAIAVIEAIRNDWNICPSCIDEALAAINALPAVSVTDDMVERACSAMLSAYRRNTLPAWDRRIVREALEAALPDAP